MEYKALVHDPFLCTGCMRCMTTCSTYNNGATSLSRARIQIARHEGHAITRIDEEDELIFEALHCQQCDKPYCMLFCPVSAISRNKETGAMEINYNKCIGCRMCMSGCPFGAIRYDVIRNRVIKCDLCGGDPQCVKLCPMEAIKFLPKTVANTPKIDYLSKKIMETRPGATQQIHAGDIRNVNS
ncbi:MAG: 4Fe-4S dicluster domain-containing protein [Dehalococcoidales bacterium]|nr:4Fe-4S dicluster domain-containing protein [Dehalococcoidales bacterium]